MKDFHKNWKFTLTEQIYGHLMNLDESEFQTVHIPHDYSIEQPYNQEVGDGCTGYLVGGLGWYRKKFLTTEDMKDKKIFLCFDGIYNRSNIYFNEKFLKFHPYGYSPCIIDVTEYMNEKDNVIAVQVDHTRYADSRWYTGSGIYRKVSLHILPKTYIPLWGIKITTPDASSKKANIKMEIEIRNEDKIKEAAIKTEIISPSGNLVTSTTKRLEVGETCTAVVESVIESPHLWNIHQGDRYEAITTLIVDGQSVQEKKTQFGIRFFHFDVDKGFYFNGRKELIKGVCLHHDAGLVGAAVPLDVWRRRLDRLKACGCNAIRTAHNPASEDFIELCDEMGFLVQEEFYDEWDNPKDKRFNMKERKVDYITQGHHEFFKDYARSDLQAVIHRDFNHPCIIQWSIGNEIEWTYPKYTIATGYFGANANGNYFWDEPPYTVAEIREKISKLPEEEYEVGKTAHFLAKWTKEIDTSRPVIANCILPSASYESGMTDALDMVGFSYRQVVYDRCHINYPDKPIMGTENLGQWHEWKQVLDKEYISGIYLWTGIDYIGESGNTDVWPRKATKSGLLDVAGFEKPSYYMFRALWSDVPSIYMTTQTLEKSIYDLDEDGLLKAKSGEEWNRRLWVWHDVNEHWTYEEGTIVIEVYSNCPSVTLYCNDNEVSTLYLKDFEDQIYKWALPYQAGRLKAVGQSGDEVIVTELVSSSDVYGARISIDREVVSIDCDVVAHIEVELVDEVGHLVKHVDAEVEFILDGPARIYGVDNGDVSFVGNHQSNKIMTHRGRAMMIIGGCELGEIQISAKVGGNISKAVKITVEESLL